MLLKENIKNIYTLTPLQEGMLFHFLYDKTSGVYFEQAVYATDTLLVESLIRSAMDILMKRHDILRTVFVSNKSEVPIQVVLKDVIAPVEWIDISKESTPDISKYCDDDQKRGFDITRELSLRLTVLNSGSTGSTLICSWHHIIMDGWSLSLLIQELIDIYSLLARGLDYHRPLPPQFRNFIQWLESKDKGAAIDRWKKYLDGFDHPTGVPRKYRAQKDHEISERKLFHRIPRVQSDALREVARTNKVTINTAIQVCWALLLSKVNYSNDVAFGMVMSGRTTEINGIENMVGLFINTVPFRLKCDSNSNFISLLRDAHEYNAGIEDIQFVPLTEMRSDTLKGRALFDHILAFQNFRVDLDNRQLNNDNKPTIFATGYSGKTSFDLNVIITVGDEIEFNFSYDPQAIEEDVITVLFKGLSAIVAQVLADPKRLLSELVLGDPGLEPFVDLVPNEKTLVDYFNIQCRATPYSIAIVCEDRQFSFNCLASRSTDISNILKKDFAVNRNNLVVIISDRNEHVVFGIFGVIGAGAAYVPVDITYPRSRVQYIIDDTAAKVILIDDASRIEQFGLATERCIILNELTGISSENSITNPIQADDLAYVIYTSGTTGNPKGVLVEHRNVVSLLFPSKPSFRFDDDIWTMLHSHSFDFSVWEIFGALLNGALLVIVPSRLTRDPFALAQILDDRKVTVLNSVPTLFKNLQKALEGRKLTSLRYVIFGGEALDINSLKGWHAYRPHVKLINMYGITETTVHVTYHEITSTEIESGRAFIGFPLPGATLAVIDRGHKKVSRWMVGELAIGGRGVARGYLNQPELTAARFRNDVFKGQRVYLSGDLGKSTGNGYMYFGRNDLQLKVRGFRIEAGEIEAALILYQGIHQVKVITAIDEFQEVQIIAYFSADRPGFSIANLRSHLVSHLPPHAIPHNFVELDYFPVNNNGKLDISKLPKPNAVAGIEDRGRSEVFENSTQETISDIIKSVLRVGSFRIDENFFNSGGDSIRAIRLVNRLNETFDADVRVRDIFECPDVRSIEKLIVLGKTDRTLRQKLTLANDEIVQRRNELLGQDFDGAVVEDVYPLSDIQAGMLVHGLLTPGVYHDQIFKVFEDDNFDQTLFRNALSLLCSKHSILRTNFEMSKYDEPLQFVYRSIDLDEHFMFEDISTLNELGKKEHLAKYSTHDRNTGFSLDRPGLWRLSIFRLTRSSYGLLFVSHHAIIDGWSYASFMTELSKTYFRLQSEPTFKPPLLRNSYRDFVVDQWVVKMDESMREFWNKLLFDSQKTCLPFHKKPLETDSGKICRQVRRMDGQISQKLIDWSAGKKVTVKDILILAFLYLIRLTTGTKDIVIGLVSNVRPEVADGDKLLGCFLNTVPLRYEITGFGNVANQALQLHNLLSELKRYDKLPLPTIASRLPVNDPAGNVLFEIAFDYQDFHIFNDMDPRTTSLDHLQLEDQDVTNTLFDLDVSRSGREFFVEIKARADLYNSAELSRLLDYYINIIAEISADANSINISSVIGGVEYAHLMNDFKGAEYKINGSPDFVTHFKKQVALGSDRIAVISGEHHFTYKFLDDWASRFSRVIANHISTTMPVPVCLPRSAEFCVAVIALWMNRCSYVPIDPNLPPSRIATILKDIGSSLVISDSVGNQQIFSGQGVKVLDLSDWITGDGSQVYEGAGFDGDDLSYIIYTSGSTGLPKGAMVKQSGMMNHMFAKIVDLEMTSDSIIVQNASLSFDISVWQMFSAFITGGRTLIVPDQTIADPQQFVTDLKKKRATVLEVVPSYLPLLIEDVKFIDDDLALEYVLVTGEAVTKPLITRLFNSLRNVRVVNAYGPTEASDDITHFIMTAPPDGDVVPLGKPILNTCIYIVDNDFNICPVGVKGEIVVGGAGVGPGYWNDPSKTSRSFVENPWTDAHDVLYRTGDLGLFSSEGVLEFHGRMDQQVKLNGHRIEIGEIENAISIVPGISQCAVILAQSKELRAFVVADRQLRSIESIKAQMKSMLPVYELPHHIHFVDTLPLNVNGKVDRAKLHSIIPHVEESIVSRELTLFEEKIQALWKNVLGKEHIGLSVNFFEAGGNSLFAIQLSSRLKRLGFNADIRLLFENPTIESLSKALENVAGGHSDKIPLLPPSQYYPVSYAQKSVLLASSSKIADMAYVVPETYLLRGNIDVDVLEKAFKTLIGRHEILRTTFHIVENEYLQKVHPIGVLDWSYVDHSQTALAGPNLYQAIYDVLSMPFDVSTGPLFRIHLWKLGDLKYAFILSMHHIITDGWSIRIMIKELLAIYYQLLQQKPVELPPLSLQYKDFSSWHNALTNRNKNANEIFWRSKLEGYRPSALPTDHRRSAIKQYFGQVVDCDVNEELRQSLLRITKERKLSLFTLLVAALKGLIYRYTGDTDLTIGTIEYGRNNVDLELQIGFYVNTVLLRTGLSTDDTLGKLLDRVRDVVSDAFYYQPYPLEMILDDARSQQKKGALDPKPLIMIALQNEALTAGAGVVDTNGIGASDVESGFVFCKYDLIVNIWQSTDKLSIQFIFDKQLFQQETIETLKRHYLGMLRCFVENIGIPLNEADIELDFQNLVPAGEKRD